MFEDSSSINMSARRYRTRLQMASATIRAWSWNSTSSSMIGDEASWNPSCEWLAMVGCTGLLPVI